MKSTVPATLVLSVSVPNRVISRMPDSPAVRRRQLSALPAPSEVTMPPPVTTTIGRPALSRMAAMCSPASFICPRLTGRAGGRFNDRRAITSPARPSGSRLADLYLTLQEGSQDDMKTISRVYGAPVMARSDGSRVGNKVPHGYNVNAEKPFWSAAPPAAAVPERATAEAAMGYEPTFRHESLGCLR